MKTIEIKEKDTKKLKRKIKLIALILSLIFIGLLVLGVLFSDKVISNNNYTTPNSYSFLGNILSSNEVYSDISFVIEERENSIYGVTLKNNELISEKMLCNNIDYSEINDFSVVFAEYDLDNNKDFVYISEKVEDGYIYKFYSVDKTGNINELNLSNIKIDTNRASVKLTKTKDKYEYKKPVFYYDGYEVLAEVGVHKLGNKVEDRKTISKNSKISIDGRYKAIPRKYSVLDDVLEYVQNVNNYLLEADKKQSIEVDLDGNSFSEYVVSFIKDKKTYVSLFDNSANFVVNLLSIDGEKDIKEIIEIADIDNDGIMEIIIVKEDCIEVHKYNNGFYY